MKTTFLLIPVFMSALSGPQVAVQGINNKQEEAAHLLGAVVREDLTKIPYKQWFDAEYDAYKVNEAALDTLGKWLVGVEMEIFMGTWCSDSRRDLPRLFKILDYLDFPEERVRMVGVDRAKKSPGGEQEGMNIHHVPTIILYMDDVEVGRIIESPIHTLEDDITAILTGEVYLPNYHEQE